MADSPSPVLQMRIQSVGSNVNLWGEYINTDLQMLEQAAKGYQTQALTGDTTITWTNYATANKGAAALLKFTGSLTSAATVTMPAYQNFILVWNAAGQTVTVKCSGGTGVAIPNNRKAFLFCDGTDYYFAGPNYIGDDITEGNNRDLVDYACLLANLAAAGIPASTGAVKVDALATAVYLISALQASGALTITDNGDYLTLGVGALGLTDGGTVSGAGSVAVNTKYLCDFTSTSYTITLPGSPSAGDIILLTKYGTNAMTLGLNSLKFNGSTSNPITTDEGQTLLRYTGASRGWVEA